MELRAMSKTRTAKSILSKISPENLQRDLRQSQRAILRQLELQADANYGELTWSQASLPDFADRLANLVERLKAGKPPQWKQDQDAAYADSAIGRLLKAKEHEQ
jgi:tRNA nucleotidyltransferase/poly(A) polymerase